MHLSRSPLLVALALAGSLFARASAPDTAEALFDHAKAEAHTEHKNVLMVFSASWCGPCRLYERFLEDPQMRPITEKGFVVQRIDVGEHAGDAKHSDTPGGVALRSLLGSAPEPGFPWIVITDPSGKPLVNSCVHGDKFDNIGYPALPNEIDWYINMLKKAAPQLSSQDLTVTRTWLQAHSTHQ